MYRYIMYMRVRVRHIVLINDTTFNPTNRQECVRELDRRLASLIALAFDDCPTVIDSIRIYKYLA